MNYLFTKFAAEYSCGAYGTSTYNNSDACTTASGGTDTSAGNLANTGMDVVFPLALGVIIIASASAFFIRNIRHKKQV